MRIAFFIAQILIAIFLVVAILIQAKGTGLGSAWGGSGDFYHSKTDSEKVVFIATIILAALFLLISIANTLLAFK